MPVTPTGIPSIEPAYYEEKRKERILMVSNEESPFGRGWYLEGLKRLHIEGGLVSVINADGSYRTYQRGVNYADARYGAVVDSQNYNMIHKESMLLPRVVQDGRQLSYSQFHEIPAGQGTDQTFIIDLGRERFIEETGLEFPHYWLARNVLDHVDISVSLDKENWTDWYRFGKPTLSHPAGGETDALDHKIHSPLLAPGPAQQVRYIRYRLGFPSCNSAHNGSGIYRVYAMGDRSRFHHTGEEKWPALEYACPGIHGR